MEIRVSLLSEIERKLCSIGSKSLRYQANSAQKGLDMSRIFSNIELNPSVYES
jgi:hypothetical protein